MSTKQYATLFLLTAPVFIGIIKKHDDCNPHNHDEIDTSIKDFNTGILVYGNINQNTLQYGYATLATNLII